MNTTVTFMQAAFLSSRVWTRLYELGGNHETLSAHRNRRDAKPNLANALVFVCALAVAGCASKAVVTEHHRFPTGIATGDAVAFLLSEYEGEKKEQFEQKFFSCVSRELKNSRLGLRIISPRELRQTAFSGLSVDRHPKSADEVFELLGDGRKVGDPATSRLRYVVLLDVTVSESPKQWDFDLTQGGPAAYQNWMKYARLNLTVLDVGQRRVAGRLIATSEGEQGSGVALLIILPIPIIVRTDPLGKACTKMGQELEHFLMMSEPAKAKPTQEGDDAKPAVKTVREGSDQLADGRYVLILSQAIGNSNCMAPFPEGKQQTFSVENSAVKQEASPFIRVRSRDIRIYGEEFSATFVGPYILQGRSAMRFKGRRIDNGFQGTYIAPAASDICKGDFQLLRVAQ